MAKLYGFNIDGEIEGVCVYRMNGQVYMRSKSSLTRKRVLKSKAFEKTRKYARDLGKAAHLGSEIYRQLPADKRKRSLYQALTGEAASLLFKGIEEHEVRSILRKKFIAEHSYPASAI